MGIVNLAGSSDTTSSPQEVGDPLDTNPRIEQSAIRAPNEADLIQQAHIRDTAVHTGSLNMSQFSDDLGILMSIPDGTPIKCVYYLNQHDTSVKQTYDIDKSIDTSYLKIINYEVTAVGDFKYSYDSQNNDSTVEGEILTYPGSKVYIGDVFLMDNGDGKTAVYTITSKERMSPRNDTFYQCRVTMIGFLTDDLLKTLDSYVYETAYFDKQNYLAGSRALIKHQSFVDKVELEKMRGVLLKKYHNKFFRVDANSYFRDDGVYDPFVVNCMFGRLSLEDRLPYPSQLLIDSNYTDRYVPLWKVITTDWMTGEEIDTVCCEKTLVQDTYSTHLSTLANRVYVDLDDSGDDVYMFTHILGFDNMSIDVRVGDNFVPLKELLHKFLKTDVTEQEIDTVVEVTGFKFFKEYPNLVNDLMVDDIGCILETAKAPMTDAERFYLTPLLLFAINQALIQI